MKSQSKLRNSKTPERFATAILDSRRQHMFSEGNSGIAAILRQESSSTSSSSDSSNFDDPTTTTAKPVSAGPPPAVRGSATVGRTDNKDDGRPNIGSNSGFRKSMEDILHLFRRRSTGAAARGKSASVSAGSTTTTSTNADQQPQRIPTKAVNEWALHDFLERRFGHDSYRVEMRGDRYEIYSPRRVRCVDGRLDLETE